MAASETAIYLQEVVKVVQEKLPEITGVKLIANGLYNFLTHEMLRFALQKKGYEENAKVLDDQGPFAMASVLFPDVIGDEDARWFAVAWGWWAKKNVRPVPSRATVEIAEGNAKLVDEGYPVLTEEDAALFADSGPPVVRPGPGTGTGTGTGTSNGNGNGEVHIPGTFSKAGQIAAAVLITLAVGTAAVIGWRRGRRHTAAGMEVR